MGRTAKVHRVFVAEGKRTATQQRSKIMNESLVARTVVKEVSLGSVAGQNYRSLNEVKLPGLMASIEEHGQLQPIAVAENEKFFDVIFGFHRIEALKRLGKSVILARVYPPGLSTIDRLAMGIVENLQRSDGDRLDLAVQV